MASSKKKKNEGGEPRRATRVTKVLPVELKVLDFAENRLAKHVLVEGDVFGGRTINISKTGLQVHSDYELDPKTLVEMSLHLNEHSRSKIKLVVQVAWARRNAFNYYGRWGMGMHILKANDHDLAQLAEFFKDSD